ncbi:MAG: geranylgeranylglyceryl/heptaprenylglyceryl phosphate synthase [Cyclobacteriaceae bacterium]
MKILNSLVSKKDSNKKSLAVLIDPDKAEDSGSLQHLVRLANENCIDFILVGGSLLLNAELSGIISAIRDEVQIPVVLFPGSPLQITPGADGILFLSLISGRNPDLLIGHHVQAAPLLKNLGMEILPTGYMLINSGKTTSVAYVSNTMPIPDDKYSLAACTAMAGEMLGLKLLYLDAGSGAEKEISPRMINAVRKAVSLPMMVGGGINTPEKVSAAMAAGADVIIVGNALEKDPGLLTGMAEKVYDWNLNRNAVAD